MASPSQTRRAAMAAFCAAICALGAEAAPVPPARPEGGAAAVVAPAPDASDPPAAAEAPQAPEAAAPPEGASAALRGLDKASGVTTLFYAPIGGEARFARLRVAVAACEASGLDGDVAYLTIHDDKEPGVAIFEGWMFAESPAFSALDHPRYDVWLASCSTRSAEGG
jgi:hypothetical protein